jgi:hypothetical protein
MKKYYFLIIVTLILGLVLTGCSLLSNISQVPATEQSGITYLTKGLPSGLVGWWRFNGDADDSSGNNNNGTVEGGGATYEPSPMGKALSFDGDDYVRVVGTSSLIGITSEITVEAWIKFSNVSDAFYVRTPFDLDPKAWGLDRYGGKLRFYIYDGTKGIACEKTWAPEVNQWYNIAGTYDGNFLKLYVDNKLYQSLEYTGAINSTGQGVVMGARHSDGGWGYLRGFLDDVRIWNVALSEDQLGKVYDFKGFFLPVENPGVEGNVINIAKAGRAIPVKFSLDGDQGLEIFEVEYGEEYPKSVEFVCGLPDPNAIALEGTDAAGGSSLSYDATNDQYTYVWKTEKAWTGTCRQLIVKLIDGTYHRANFNFTK